MRAFIASTNIFRGDAVGNHCIGLCRALRRMGIDAGLYATGYDLSDASVRPIDEVFNTITENDTLLLCYSIGDSLFEKFVGLGCYKVCYFHGVTNPVFFEPGSDLALKCQLGFEQMRYFNRFNHVICNSQKTMKNLKKNCSISQCSVVPPIFSDFPIFNETVKFSKQRFDEKLTFLSAGRMVPHKCLEDAIDIITMLSKAGFDVHLNVLGPNVDQNYFKFLINYCSSQNVLNRVNFLGCVSMESLAFAYSESDVLLVTSQDEGFCVPIIEAMNFGCTPLVRPGTAASELVKNDEILDLQNEAQQTKLYEFVEKIVKIKVGSDHSIGLKKRVRKIFELTSDQILKETIWPSQT